jgi:hypothetical protein
MSTETILIYVLSVIVIVLTFTTWNLLRKQEKAEDILAGYIDYLDQLSKVIEIADEKLKKVDQKGSFQSDDEVGFFFEQIKGLQEIFNQFQMRTVKREE